MDLESQSNISATKSYSLLSVYFQMWSFDNCVSCVVARKIVRRYVLGPVGDIA